MASDSNNHDNTTLGNGQAPSDYGAYVNVPAELRDLPRWTCWVEEKKPGKKKPDKPSFNPHRPGQYASPTDPATWSDFATAFAYLTTLRANNSAPTGLAFALNGDGIIGLDLDAVYDWKRSFFADWAFDTIRRLESYTERSPSQKGFRIFVWGQLPDGHKKRKPMGNGSSIEVYSTAKFLSVTGDRRDFRSGARSGVSGSCVDDGCFSPWGFDDLMDRSAELLTWYEETFGTRPRTHKKPTEKKGSATQLVLNSEPDLDEAKLARLFRRFARMEAVFYGDTTAYASQSEADLALANVAVLAGWSNQEICDLLVMARRYSASDHERKPLSYYQRTIAKAHDRDGERAGDSNGSGSGSGSGNDSRESSANQQDAGDCTADAGSSKPANNGIANGQAATSDPAATSVPELTREPDLIKAIRRDIALAGLIGESDKALLLYLAYSSRRLNKPLSVIIKGPSGSGKDEIQRRPADLMPPDAILDCMSLTPQALYYNEPGWLRHKIILGGERKHDTSAEQRDRTAAVRQLLSHGYITKATVEHLKSLAIRQDGPVSYSETTTQDSIFEEDANRCVQIDVVTPREQVRRVLQGKAAAYGPDAQGTEQQRQAAIARHHEFQESLALAYADVRIPYAGLLADRMPAEDVRVMRIFEQVLALIEVIAFLHQHTRPRNEHGQLLATRLDYRLARQLLLGSLHAVIGLADYAEYQPLAAQLPRPPQGGEFTTSAAAVSLNTTRHVALDRLDRLKSAGWLTCTQPGTGNQPARWKWLIADPEESVLPSVNSLKDAPPRQESS
jgi:hypothetical protein